MRKTVQVCLLIVAMMTAALLVIDSLSVVRTGVNASDKMKENAEEKM